MEKLNSKITRNEMESMQRDLALDLTALFNIMQDEVNGIVKIAVKEEWTPEQLINKIEGLI